MSEVVPMKRVIVVLVVLGLAIGGGLWWQLSSSSDDAAKPAPSVTTSPTPPPTAPAAGYRLVGRGGAVVEVPESWRTGATKCGTAVADTVIFDSGGPVPLCAIQTDKTFSSVLIAPYDVGATFDAIKTVKTFSSRADDAFIVVNSSDKAVFDHIVASYRHLPSGSTTVPELFGGASDGEPGVNAVPTRGEIAKRLERFGLKVTFAKLDSVRGKARSYSTPVAGSVVAVGSIVVVALN